VREGDGADPGLSPLPSPALDAQGSPCQGTQAVNPTSHGYTDTEQLRSSPALRGTPGFTPQGKTHPRLPRRAPAPITLPCTEEGRDAASPAHLVDVPPRGVQRREEPLQFCSATKIEDPGGQELLAVLSKLLNTKREAGRYPRGPRPALGRPAPKHRAHHDTVLLAGLRGDSGDVRELRGAQRAEEARLAVLVAGESLLVRQHEAAGDTRRRGNTLGDHLHGVGKGGGQNPV